jgi:tripartite-type tricarboxylate transporter receptor subunit TctC
MTRPIIPTRRGFIHGSAALLGATALGLPRGALAQDFPSRPFNVVIPTAEGGGADRDARAFVGVWSKHIGQSVEFGYYPGAAGQVGYKFFMEREPDAYNLIFANLGPEVIMLETQDTGIEVGRDIVYIQQISSEPMSIFVGERSPIRTLEELVETAKQRTVTIGTSRLPHPGSIGILALADATGGNFKLVPYGGGNPTAMAAITMETDAAVLPFANPVSLGDQVRTLGVFATRNPAPAESGNAPTVNEALGTSLPNFDSSRAWGLHRAAYDAFPDRVARLKETMDAAVNDPAYLDAVRAAGLPTVFIDAGGEDVAMATANAVKELARKYRDMLAGA